MPCVRNLFGHELFPSGRAGARPRPIERPRAGAAASPSASRRPPRSPARGPMSHAEVRKIFFGLMLAAFLAALNQTIIATALPTIGRYFGDFENLSWIVTAYLLTSTAVAPLYGKLSDIWGRRAMILAAIGLFVAGSAAAAAAPDMTWLILGRGLQGIGGGGILPLCQSVIADVVAPRERGRYQAYMGVVWVTSGVAGPVFGGMHGRASPLVADLLGQRAARPRRGAAHQHLSQEHPAPRPPPQARRARRRPDDGLGIPLLLALTWGGTRCRGCRRRS